MPIFRSRRLVAVVATVCALAGLPALAAAQNDKKVDKKQQEKQDQAKRQQFLAFSKLVDGVVAGQPAPADFPLDFKVEFSLKAQENKTFVPYSVSTDPAKAPSGPLMMYVRVAPKGGAAATAPPATAATPPAKEEKKDDKAAQAQAPVSYPFEDLRIVDFKTGKVTRAFAAPAGDYDMYIAVAELKNGGKDKNQPFARTAVTKQSVTVPNYWGNDLTSTPIMLAAKVEPLSAPITADQQVERPFVLGNMEITPAASNAFTKKDELSIIFLIYNVGVNDQGKPDLEVQYNFNQKTGDTEKFFNRTQPQLFNASTLPPQFDVRVGHQVVAGQTIPLASFPEGEYHLQIKVNDKIANKTLDRDIRFTVTP